MKKIINKDNNLTKIGLIGLGRWGKNIVKSCQQISTLKLTCVASGNPDNKKLIPDDCYFSSNWRDLINFPELDGVIICTPPKTHFEIAQCLLEAGYPILIEKPLTLNYDEAKTIYKLSLIYNQLIMIDFTQLFNNKFISLKKSLKQVGDIKYLLTKAGNYGPYREDTPVLWDWAPHDLSMLISLMGQSPRKISAHKIKEDINQDYDKSIWQIHCSFDKQIESTTLIGNMMPKCRKVGILGSYGMLVFDDLSVNPLSFHNYWRLNEFPTQKGESIDFKHNKEPLVMVLESFTDLIKKNIKKHWSLSMGVEITRLLNICQLYKQSYS